MATALRAKRPRTSLTIATVRRANPALDDVQGPRAHLLPVAGIAALFTQPSASSALGLLDAVVDELAGAECRSKRAAYERVSPQRAPSTVLNLYTLDDSAEMLAAALFAGFFVFGSEFELPGRPPLEERGMTNLELGGPKREPHGEDPGGRIVLELSAGSADRLMVGKRSIKTARRAGEASGGTRYRLSVNEAFERSWEAIVQAHGVDWLGFRRLRAAYAALHRMRPQLRARALRCQPPATGRDGCRRTPACVRRGPRSVAFRWEEVPEEANAFAPPRVLSLELWDDETGELPGHISAPTVFTVVSGELASAEVGVLTGCCYTCVSLAAQTARYPRCDHVRAQASVLWLQRAGVALYDVGTTAAYYVDLFGFRRTTRPEFVRLWRAHRSRALVSAGALASAPDVRTLLEAGRDALGGGANAPRAAAAPPKPVAAVARPAKPAVTVTGLPSGVGADALACAFAHCGAVAKASVVERAGERFGVLLFADAAGAAAARRLDRTTLAVGGADAHLSVCTGPTRAKEAKKQQAVHKRSRDEAAP